MKAIQILCVVSLVFLCVSCSREEAGAPQCPERVMQRPSGCEENRLLPGEVRAIRIQDACDLIGGEEAQGSIGDFKIYNSLVQFVVQDIRLSIAWAPYGGNLLDADRARPASSSGNDLFGENFLNLGGRSFRPNSIEITNDGKDGQPAVIKLEGIDGGLPILDSLAETQSSNISAVHYYILEPDSRSLMLKTEVTNNGKRNLILPVGDVLLTRGILNMVSRSYGFDFGAIVQGIQTKRDVDLLVGEAEGVSYGWLSPQPYIGMPDISDVKIVVNEELSLPPREKAAFTRYVIVGDGDFASIEAEAERIRGGSAKGRLRCSVAQTDGAPVDDVGITVYDSYNKFFSHMTMKENGWYEAELDPGTYRLQASGPERYAGQSVSVTIVTDTTTTSFLTVPPQGLLSYSILGKDFDGLSQGNVPAKIFLQGPVEKRVLSHTGLGTEPVLAGTYSWTVSKGFAYSISTGTVQVLEGSPPATLEATIQKVVDTSGWMDIDFHNHSMRSVDCEAGTELKVRDFLAEGLDSIVATEHDNIYDYGPDIEKLGVKDALKVVRGEEVSPVFAHFNTYPLVPCSSKQLNGAVLFYSYDKDGKYIAYTPPQLFRKMREAGAKVIQVNHPYSQDQGYLAYVGFTPEKSVEDLDPEIFSLDFDSMEIMNSKNADQLETTLPAWYSLLNQGVAKTAVGSSDSHHPGQEPGYPRNYFPSEASGPGKITDDEVVSAVKSHNLLMCGGPFVTFTINDSSMGSLVRPGSMPLNLKIKVQAPLWMDVSTVEVIANGVTLETIPVTNTSVVRYDGEVTDSPSKDTWYAIIARGTKDLGPMYQGAIAFSITNPIWVDVNKNGKFDPPGIQ